MTSRRLLAVAAAAAVAALVASAGPGRHHVTGGPPIVAETRAPPDPATPTGPFVVARAFVDAYVGFIYRRLTAAQLPGASRSVRRRIDGMRPAPPAAVLAAADPRLRSLRVNRTHRRAARALAVIDDGSAVYDLALELRRLPSGWTITDLSETS